ncbi:MAG TPA: hypothetical protein VMZ29_04240 [Candidatus Bathyarchaeia archaeon]|nr:hypothetical protein [Candidatus Bathyarchaeia archaeon]
MASRGKIIFSIILVGGVLFAFNFSVNAQYLLKAQFPTNIFLIGDDNGNKLIGKTTEEYSKEEINIMLDRTLFISIKGEVIFSVNENELLLNDSRFSYSKILGIPKCGGIISDSINDLDLFIEKEIYLMDIHILEIYNYESECWFKLTDFNCYQISGITIGTNIGFILVNTIIYKLIYRRTKIKQKKKENESIIVVPK